MDNASFVDSDEEELVQAEQAVSVPQVEEPIAAPIAAPLVEV